MTILTVIAIRDTAVRAFNTPVYVPTIEVGMRSFYDEVKREAPDNQMNKHPEDFELWYLGQYDNESGRHVDEDNVRILARGKDVAA